MADKSASTGWQAKAEAKKKQQEMLINAWPVAIPHDIAGDKTKVKTVPSDCGILTESELQITESAPSVIVTNIASRLWSAEQVLRAFVTRAVIAQRLTNPLSEIFFEKGLERARELDRIQQNENRVVGPLHGLPISLKDTLNVAGEDSTMGFVGLIGNGQTQNDIVVDMLYEAGAVFYCKTNVPQALMSGECVNFIFGRTSSPWNTQLSAGGSSGGEGSLVSLGGSSLGIGGDIAGSIRTPANFNGIYGLCPSPGRFPSHRAEAGSGDSLIIPVYGPLARGVDGLEFYTRTILGLEPWKHDHHTFRMPWDEDKYQEGLGNKHNLCFAFMPNDGIVQPDPPIKRCMSETRRLLQEAGHDCIDLDFVEGAELMDIATGIFSATGGKDVWDVLDKSGEPLIKEAFIGKPENAISACDYVQLAIRLNVLRAKYLTALNATAATTRSGRPVDGIIMPSGGTVAPPHGTMEYFTYEAISNVLNWTCATIPVGFVDAARDLVEESFQPLSEHDKRNHDKYSPQYYEHAPVCLQVMGRQHDEEKVLGMLRAIDKALGRDAYYNA
ncbi:hypothetical protein G7054_g5705 [Neopestalotiopsis clavispora]|nr:hypothetical protein G7054_g5705 [Neopestalotiopsis clavispora]